MLVNRQHFGLACGFSAFRPEAAARHRTDLFHSVQQRSAAAIVLFYLLLVVFWGAALAPLVLGALFYVAVAVVLAQVAWHWWLIRKRTRDGCFRAFRVNHWIGFTLFAGVAGSYALR